MKSLVTPLHLCILLAVCIILAVCLDIWTPLMRAADKGDADEVARLIVMQDANVHHVGKGGQTALMQAASGGHVDVCRLLVVKSAVVNAADTGGQTALMKAASGGHLDVCRFLVHMSADVNAANKYAGWLQPGGSTALMFAAGKGHLDVCSFLVESGADVNAADKGGQTALMKAASGGHLDVCRFLVQKGAVVNASDKYAGRLQLLQYAGWLQPGGSTALMFAAGKGHLDVCSFLVESGADVNAADKGGQTALMKAASGGHLDVCRFLVKKGAVVNAANKGGQTALMKAAFAGHIEVGRFLVQKGADVNAADWYGNKAPFWALLGIQFEVYNWLANEEGARWTEWAVMCAVTTFVCIIFLPAYFVYWMWQRHGHLVASLAGKCLKHMMNAYFWALNRLAKLKGMLPASQQRNDTAVRVDQSLLECPICHEIYANAMNLPCTHKLCAHCLERYCEAPSVDKTCPVCREPLSNKEAHADHQTRNLVDEYLHQNPGKRRSDLTQAQIKEIDKRIGRRMMIRA